MLFTLEALEAKHGDSLILHYGPEDSPRIIVIDGGPPGVYKRKLRPRLEQLKEKLADEDEPLPIEMLMVSHIDSDHIAGVLNLTAEMVDKDENSEPQPYEILTLWLNSFDETAGNTEDEMISVLASSVRDAARQLGLEDNPAVEHHGGASAASVPQGQRLRRDAQRLNIPLNAPFQGLVMATGSQPRKVPLGDGLSFTIVGPSETRIRELNKEWEKILAKQLKKKALEAEAAAYLDKSAPNLASTVVLAECEGKTMLLCGDARGDDVLAGLENIGLLKKGGKMKLDLLKMPHHGSDRNVDSDFFERLVAAHYVISGDGNYGNPEAATLDMLIAARPDDEFTLHLTNRTGKENSGLKEKLAGFLKKNKDRQFKVVFREETALSLKVDLLSAVSY